MTRHGPETSWTSFDFTAPGGAEEQAPGEPDDTDDEGDAKR